jgi:hypothetical protein
MDTEFTGQIFENSELSPFMKIPALEAEFHAVTYPGIFFSGWGVQQIQLRIEGRENGDLGAVAP